MKSSARFLLYCLFLCSIFFLASRESLATTRRVPADHTTIQQAINASVNGDTVLVSPGVYVENIDFVGKAITVTSEAGPQVTIIDGNNISSVAKFVSGEGRASVLNGFTLRRGVGSLIGEGGGIVILGSSPTITNNIISDNKACSGSGIAVELGSPLIQGNTIKNNFVFGCFGGIGGGILLGNGAQAQVLDNSILNNSTDFFGGGIAMSASGSVTIRRNIISGNQCPQGDGGGISMINFTEADIVENLITGNSASNGGGIFWVVVFGSRGPLLVNNTIADNDSQQGSGIFADGFDLQTLVVNNIIVAKTGQTAISCGNFGSGTPIFRFNNAFSPQGMAYGGICSDKTGMDGNISADPLFVNPPVGDYHLLQGSPSIDVGDNTAPNLPATDFDGDPRILDGNGDGVAVVDMGIDESLPTSPSFDICLQDDGNGDTFRINSTTGNYQFTRCVGRLVFSGTGNLIRKGGIITLQDNSSDRRVIARIDGSARGTASVQIFSQGTAFTVTDKNTANNRCSCP